MNRILGLFFMFSLCFSLSNAQVSLSQLKGMGINSEEDLKRMGVSDAEIQRAKEQFFGSQKTSDSTSSSVGEISSRVEQSCYKS